MKGLNPWLAGMSAAPVEIALALGEDGDLVEIVVSLGDGSALNAHLAQHQHGDGDADLLALRDQIWSAATLAWSLARQALAIN